MEPTTVAVIGLGASGLVALKNLKEQGFDVTGFERSSYIGGLWKYSEDGCLSVLKTTLVNISKERGCFTDFPYPESVPSYPNAAQVHDYLTAYAAHFNLSPHFRLNSPIQEVLFEDARSQWIVRILGKDDAYFDKVLICIGGTVGKPNMPTIPGLDKFAGTSVHVQYFKRPQDFAGKRVMVVGFGNSAADTATSLVGHASKVYLSHRHGARMLPRMYNGAPIDHTHSLRLFTIQCLILKYFPQWGERTFDKFLKGMQDKSFTLRDEWGFEPAQKVPMVSDTLVDCLEAGSIESVPGISRVLNASTVQLSNNTMVEIDAIIWCTGYISDFSIIDPRFSPSTSLDSMPKWSEAKGSNNKPVFKLYYNVFSPTAPSSLAFLGNVHFAIGGFLVFDLASMAVAQVWLGASSLPSESQMNNEIEKQHEWLADLASRGFNVSPGTVDAGPWMHAMNGLAGTGVDEYLGYGWKGWWFWIRNRKFCDLLMGGLWSPCIYRVFKGKRDRWEGARGAVERINALKCSKKED